MCCIFCFLCEGGHFNAIIHFSELPTEYEREFHKQIWTLRNLRKPLPNSAEARRRTQKIEPGGIRVGRAEETSAPTQEKSC